MARQNSKNANEWGEEKVDSLSMRTTICALALLLVAFAAIAAGPPRIRMGSTWMA